MCGRFTLSTSPQTLQRMFELPEAPNLPARFNIAPSEAIAAIRLPKPNAQRELALLRWGLIPAWAKAPDTGAKMINARSETAATSPAFRAAFRRRRCLVPADGFFEWQKLDRRKQPFYMRMQDGQPFAFAGLWEHWQGKDGQVIDTCTILTTDPSDLLRPIHDRMPVILDPAAYTLWLDPSVQDPERLRPLLRPYPVDRMEAYPVSQLVNSPVNDLPDCIAPLAA